VQSLSGNRTALCNPIIIKLSKHQELSQVGSACRLPGATPTLGHWYPGCHYCCAASCTMLRASSAAAAAMHTLRERFKAAWARLLVKQRLCDAIIVRSILGRVATDCAANKAIWRAELATSIVLADTLAVCLAFATDPGRQTARQESFTNLTGHMPNGITVSTCCSVAYCCCICCSKHGHIHMTVALDEQTSCKLVSFGAFLCLSQFLVWGSWGQTGQSMCGKGHVA
jgi:hypothetical protein